VAEQADAAADTTPDRSGWRSRGKAGPGRRDRELLCRSREKAGPGRRDTSGWRSRGKAGWGRWDMSGSGETEGRQAQEDGTGAALQEQREGRPRKMWWTDPPVSEVLHL